MSTFLAPLAIELEPMINIRQVKSTPDCATWWPFTLMVFVYFFEQHRVRILLLKIRLAE